jgi:hypothetical protein
MDQRALLLDGLMWEFRSLGGMAENVRLGEGPLGRGLFSVNPGSPVRLHVPESLLLPTNFVSFEGGTFRVATNAPLGARQRTFIEAYERHLSWGVRRRETAELLELLQEAPAKLRQLLETPFQASAWLAGFTLQAIAERFFAARALDYKGVRVIAPVLDLINHGLGPRFQSTTGIALHGKFASEVVSRYGPTDPLGIFSRWGFDSSCEFFALSLGLHLRTSRGLLVIERDADPVLAGGGGGFVPAISVTGDTITLSHLLLGHKGFPKLARGIFYRILREAGHSDAEETFDRIQHINRMAYYQLAVAAESAAPPLRRILRNLARYQLLAMSYNVGASEAPSGGAVVG